MGPRPFHFVEHLNTELLPAERQRQPISLRSHSTPEITLAQESI
jgi:hypothetical protein